MQLLGSLPSSPTVALQAAYAVAGAVSTPVTGLGAVTQAGCGLTGTESRLDAGTAGARSCALTATASTDTTSLCAASSTTVGIAVTPSPALGSGSASGSGVALVFRLNNATTICGVSAVTASATEALVTTAVDAGALATLVYESLRLAAAGTAVAATATPPASTPSNANAAALAALYTALRASLRSLNVSSTTLLTAPSAVIVAPPCLDVKISELTGGLVSIPAAPTPSIAVLVSEAASGGSSSITAAIASAAAGALVLALAGAALRRRRRKRTADAAKLKAAAAALAAGSGAGSGDDSLGRRAVAKRGLPGAAGKDGSGGDGDDDAELQALEIGEAEVLGGGVANPLAGAKAGSSGTASLKSGTAVTRGGGGSVHGEVSEAESIRGASGKAAAVAGTDAQAAASSLATATLLQPRLLEGDAAHRLVKGEGGALHSTIALSKRTVAVKPGAGGGAETSVAAAAAGGASAAAALARSLSRPKDDIGVSKLGGRNKAAPSQRLLQQRVVPIKPGELVESKGTPDSPGAFLASFSSRHLTPAAASSPPPPPEEEVIDLAATLGFDPVAVEVGVAGVNPLSARGASGTAAAKASPARRVLSRRLILGESGSDVTAAVAPTSSVGATAAKTATPVPIKPSPGAQMSLIASDELSGVNPLLHVMSGGEAGSSAHPLRLMRGQLSASRRILRDADVAAVQAGMSRDEFLRTQRRKKLTYGQQLLNSGGSGPDEPKNSAPVVISAEELALFVNPLAPDASGVPAPPPPPGSNSSLATSIVPLTKRPSPAVAAVLAETVHVPSPIQRQFQAASTRMLLNPMKVGGLASGGGAVAPSPTVVRRPAANLASATASLAAAAAAVGASPSAPAVSGLSAALDAPNPMRGGGAAAAPAATPVSTSVSLADDGTVVVQAKVEGRATMADFLARRRAAAAAKTSGGAQP